MPCQDSSSNITIKLDKDDQLIHFDFKKISCGKEIEDQTGYLKHCEDKSLKEILDLKFVDLIKILKVKGEEQQFILYLEWDCLRSAIAQYLGIDDAEFDTERCLISKVSQTKNGTTITQVVLPPKEMPEISSCRLNE